MNAQLLANLNWLLADKIFRIIGGLIIGVWVARFLGPEKFGILSYAFAFVALFDTIAKINIDMIVVRDLTRAPDKESLIMGTIFAIKLFASLISLILVFLFAWLAQDKDIELVVLIVVIAVGMMSNLFDAYDIYFQAHVMSRYVVFAKGISFLFFSGVRVALILLKCPVVYFAATSTLEITFGGLLLAWIFRGKKKATSKWQYDRRIMVSLLRDGLPLIVSSALIVIHMRIDQVMIGQMLSSVEVGIYSAAIRLSEAWLFVPQIIVQTVTPYFIRLRESNLLFYQERLLQIYSIMFWLSVLVGILTTFFGKIFIYLLFGELYQNAYLPLVLTIWTGIFISQTLARSIWMIGENLQGYRLINNLITVPINVVLNWFLIPIYGVIGASLASLISMGLGAWIIPFFFKPMRVSNKQMLLGINPKYMFTKNLLESV
jgi:PST family polysaccharide transporter